MALDYLSARGLQLRDRNWRSKIGELDLVMLDGDHLVFVEVKTRFDGLRAESLLLQNVTLRKKRKLRALAQLYLLKLPKKIRPKKFRIDVVGVLLQKEDRKILMIEHLRNAV